MELTGGYCFCCVTKKETSELRVFLVNNKTMKSLLQIDELTLCLICMRVARQIDKFLNNVLASKLLITNSSSPNSELISSNFRLLIQPLHCLATTPIEIGSFGGNHGVGEGIKTGMKTENIENYNELESSDNFCETEVTNVKTETENVEVQDYESADDAVSIKMDIEEGTFLNCDEKFDENEFEFKSKLLKGESFLVGNEDNEKRPIESNNSNTTLSERCNINEELQIEGFTCQLNKPGNANDDLSMWKTVNLSNEVYVMEEHTEKAKNAQYPTSKYKCESCCEVLNVEELYNKNKEAHMAGQYISKVCKQCFVLQKNLHDHESTHFVRNPCKGDYLSPEKENETAPQLLAAAFNRLQCPKCPADYKLQRNLNRHMQTKHNEKISLHCSELVPTKTFTSPNLLNHPEKSDVQTNCNHACTVCEAKNETQEKLNDHVSDHNKESRNEERGPPGHRPSPQILASIGPAPPVSSSITTNYHLEHSYASKKTEKRINTRKMRRRGPTSAYMLWIDSVLEQIKTENPDLKLTEIANKCGLMWIKMKDKSEWEKKAARLQEEYNRGTESNFFDEEY